MIHCFAQPKVMRILVLYNLLAPWTAPINSWQIMQILLHDNISSFTLLHRKLHFLLAEVSWWSSRTCPMYTYNSQIKIWKGIWECPRNSWNDTDVKSNQRLSLTQLPCIVLAKAVGLRDPQVIDQFILWAKNPI